MIISHIALKNWRNFQSVNVDQLIICYNLYEILLQPHLC